MARIMTEVLTSRYEFTQAEMAQLGRELAEVYNERAKLIEDEKSQKAQLNERNKILEAKVGTLSRQVTAGFEMRQFDCTLMWDSPNVGEVSYFKKADGMLLKSRAMTLAERQLDLPLQEQSATQVETSKNNVLEFFDGKAAAANDGAEQPQDEPAAVAEPPEPTEAGAPQKGKKKGKKQSS